MAIEGEYLEKLSWQEGSYYDTLSGTPSKTDWELLMGRTVEEDNLEGRKFTLGNTILELKDYSWLAKVMSKIVEQVVAHQMGIKPDYENQDFRMCICSSLDASLQGIIINSGGVFPELIAKRIIKSANRKLK